MRVCGLGRGEFTLLRALPLGGDDGVHTAIFGQEEGIAGRDFRAVFVDEAVPRELQGATLVLRGQFGGDCGLAHGDDRASEARLVSRRIAEGHAGGDDRLHGDGPFGVFAVVADEPAKRGTAVLVVGAHDLQGTSPCVGHSRQDVSKTEQVPT